MNKQTNKKINFNKLRLDKEEKDLPEVLDARHVEVVTRKKISKSRKK